MAYEVVRCHNILLLLQSVDFHFSQLCKNGMRVSITVLKGRTLFNCVMSLCVVRTETHYLSLVMRKPVIGLSDQVNTNLAVQPQKMA